MNRESAAECFPWFELQFPVSWCLPVPVLKSECTVCNCLSRLNLGCAQVSTSNTKISHLCILRLSLSSYSPSVSVTVPDVQGKLPWRPTTPTAVWASPSMPGSEVRKTIQAYQDSGRQCIVGVLQWPRHGIFKNACRGPLISFKVVTIV